MEIVGIAKESNNIWRRVLTISIGALALIVGLGQLAAAQNDKPTKDEIAKELANPNTALTSLKFQNQYFSFDGDLPGADDLDMFKVFLQPTLPFPLASGKTIWVRPGVPFVFNQPAFDADSRRLDDKTGLGDITLDVQYGTTLENGFLWSVGFSSVFPTASEEGLGSEYWTLGPGFQLGLITEKSIFGVFANHQWDIAGDGTSSSETGISLTAIQLFCIFIPGGGWNYGSMPIMTYNHESEEWTVPLHVTAGKTFIINGRPWKISLDLNYYVERPDAIAPEWMVGINVAPVVENIFARWF
jgi:hypothetical protein